MIDLSHYIDIPVLCAVYLIVELLKLSVLKTDNARSFIPVIAPIIGATISICIFKFYPQLSISINVTAAFANGVISGSAATGANQIYKKIYSFLNPMPNNTSA